MFYSLTWTKSKHALLEDRSYDQSLTNGYASAEKTSGRERCRVNNKMAKNVLLFT